MSIQRNSLRVTKNGVPRDVDRKENMKIEWDFEQTLSLVVGRWLESRTRCDTSLGSAPCLMESGEGAEVSIAYSHHIKCISLAISLDSESDSWMGNLFLNFRSYIPA